ncbi:hypothetical protein ACHAQJ_005610 [Trichoderma viride]
MVRYLLASCSIEDIQKLFEEEGCRLSLLRKLLPPPQENAHQDSILPEPEPEPQAAPSNTTGDGISESSHITLPDNTIVHQREEIAMMEQPPSTPANMNEENVSGGAFPMWQKEYTCGLCNEQGMNPKFSRRNDLQRHIEGKHHTNKLWICSPKDCRRVFQWQGAYKEHVRSHHKSRVKVSDAEILTLCPQTVFACGFEDCNKVYEAPSEFETGRTKEKYVTHVVNHFRFMKKPTAWTFTLRIRNLLRQGDLFNVWPPRSLSANQKMRLNWDSSTSIVLQKLLETRHLGDLNFLVHNAVALGSNPSKEVQQLVQGNLTVPIFGECQANVHQNEMPTTQFTVLPMESVNVNVLPLNVDYGASLIVPNYTDVPISSYQPQPLMYQDPMQEMLDSLIVQPVQQQYFSTDYTGPTEWTDGDEESDDFA